MNDIAIVIGWKFDHQPGMATIDGVITEFPGGIPSQEDQDTWTAEYEAHIAATQHITDRRDAMHELLPESMYLPAMLEQALADREGGKDLERGLEAAVNIYDQILRDNPEPR